MTALLIKNGEIVTADQRYRADIWCEEDTITGRIGPGLTAPAGAEVIDAAGKYVFPGFIDPHVHIYLPFMGTFAKDDYDSASRAAGWRHDHAYRNVLSQLAADDAARTYKLWMSKAEGISACDFTFHMGVARFDESTRGATPQDRERRHRIVQNLPGVQGGVWGR